MPESKKASLRIGPVKLANLAARATEEAESVLDHLKTVRVGLYELYNTAVEIGDRNGGALLARALHENLDKMGRLTGEVLASPLIQNNTTITNNTLSIRENAEFAQFQANLTRVLTQFPDALRAVIAEFEKLDAVPALEHDADDDAPIDIAPIEHHAEAEETA